MKGNYIGKKPNLYPYVSVGANQGNNPYGPLSNRGGVWEIFDQFFFRRIAKWATGAPWTLANGFYNDKSFYVRTQSTTPNAIRFKSDGTKFYVFDATGNVYQYSCSTAWDVSTASYETSYDSPQISGNAKGIAFKNDGTKMYLMSSSTKVIYQYSLSTAWDVSTASYDSKLNQITSTSNPTGIFFKPDGTKLFVSRTIGGTSGNIDEYALSTAWDVSTATYTTTGPFNIATFSTDLVFSDDGKKVFICADASGVPGVQEYALTTAWDASTRAFSATTSVSNYINLAEVDLNGIDISPDGKYMYLIGAGKDSVFTFQMA